MHACFSHFFRFYSTSVRVPIQYTQRASAFTLYRFTPTSHIFLGSSSVTFPSLHCQAYWVPGQGVMLGIPRHAFLGRCSSFFRHVSPPPPVGGKGNVRACGCCGSVHVRACAGELRKNGLGACVVAQQRSTKETAGERWSRMAAHVPLDATCGLYKPCYAVLAQLRVTTECVCAVEIYTGTYVRR